MARDKRPRACEAWYASLLHMCLRANGVDVRVEDASSHVRATMVVLTGGRVFVLEFTMADGEGSTKVALDAALAQMRERGDAKKYRDRGEPGNLVGVACGREARNLIEIRAEPALLGDCALRRLAARQSGSVNPNS